MRNTIAFQLVRYNLSRFSLVIFQQPLKETPCSRTITTGLEKHINHFAVLANCTPQVLLLAIYLYENLVNEECISESLMPFSQSSRILWTELVAP